jgi:pimeloyl-ACP methyl ester carboxylesterase
MVQRQIVPGVYIDPRISETAAGKVQFDLTQGDGPVVLSVHGGLGGADQGRLIADWLADEDYRILSPSRPGYLGTPLGSGVTVDGQADLLAALLDTLEIRQVALLSYSSGGPVAYSLAARHPERIAALVAISSVSGPHPMPETGGAVRDALFLSTPGQRLIRFTMERFPRAFLNGTLAQIGYLPKGERKRYVDHVLNSPEALAFMKGMIGTMDPYSQRAQGTRNDLKQHGTMPPLPFADIICPTLTVHGTHDADAKFYQGVRAHEHIKGAERYWIEGGDHVAFWLSPEAPKAQSFARAFVKEHTTT